MATTFEADGHTWDVYLSSDEPHEGVRALVFRCSDDSGRGWRVVEVPAAEWTEGDRVARADAGELRRLYDRSQPFDYAHDPKAHERHIGESP